MQERFGEQRPSAIQAPGDRRPPFVLKQFHLSEDLFVIKELSSSGPLSEADDELRCRRDEESKKPSLFHAKQARPID